MNATGKAATGNNRDNPLCIAAYLLSCLSPVPAIEKRVLWAKNVFHAAQPSKVQLCPLYSPHLYIF